MKLRLRGNSIRMRLTKSEVERLETETSVEEFVEFAADDSDRFCYRLVKSDKNAFKVTNKDNTLQVSVPQDVINAWVMGDEIGIEAETGGVSLLIEKDFECLKPRPGEDQTDNFPHPNAAEAC